MPDPEQARAARVRKRRDLARQAPGAGSREKRRRVRHAMSGVLALLVLVVGVMWWQGRQASTATHPRTVAEAGDASPSSPVSAAEGSQARPPPAGPTGHARPFPPLARPLSPVREALPGLRERAQDDDASAALDLFALLDYCRQMRPEGLAPEALRAMPEDVRETLLAGAERRLALCEGVTAEDLGQAHHWLDLAARLGNAQARYLYAALGADVVGGLQAVARDEALLSRYKARARGYLDELVRDCSAEAAYQVHLGHAGAGILHPPDAFQALVYGRLAQMIAPGPLAEQNLARLAAGLGSQADEALARAARMYESYCR